MLAIASSSSPIVNTRVPFWSPPISLLSKDIWLPISSNLIKYDWSFWNNYSKSLKSNSWFSVDLNIAKNFPQNPIIYDKNKLKTWKDSTKEGKQQLKDQKKTNTKSSKTGELPPNSVKKIKLNPTQKQKEVLNNWMNTNRWVYNRGVKILADDYEKNKDKPKEEKDYLTKTKVNNLCVNNSVFINKNQWALDTPQEVRASAINDLFDNIKSSIALLKSGNIDHFEIKFKSKKEPQQSFKVRHRRTDYKKSLTQNAFIIYPTFFGKNGLKGLEMEIKAFKPLPNKIDHDSRLVKTRLGDWYLCIPIRVDKVNGIRGESQTSNSNSISNTRICSLDPGVRTFQTIFDVDGAMIEVGKNDMSKIYRLSLNNDNLQSRISQAHGKKKYRMKKALLRSFQKIKNLIKEVHNKLVCFLVQNYDVILLPSFETSQMVVKNVRKIRSKTVRSMLTWSHYSFKQKLLYKSSLTNGKCQVIICGEEYTSKTCTRCGHIHEKLGGSKKFKCPKCKLEIDRDYNGARNILLKNSSHLGLRIQGTLGLPPVVIQHE